MSLSSDTMMTMPVQPAYSNGSGGGWGGFGGEGAWFIIILFLFAFLGWGNGGWGAGGGSTQGYDTRADIQRGFDNSSVITKLDGITNGICDSTYALNNTMTTGFSNAELSRCNQQAALMQQLSSMAMDNQQCCCETQRTIERGFCDTNFNNQNNTRDIIENQNSNTRAVLDALTAQRIEAKDEKIAELQSLVNSLNLAQSQANQNNYLVNTLRPCPTPAYITCNPWGGQVAYGSCGCGNGCGC